MPGDVLRAGTSRLSSAHLSFRLFLWRSARLSARLLCRLLGFLLAVTLACAIADRAMADEIGGAAALAHEPLVFDIAPQPLASALNSYGDLTGREVLYDTALAQGRVSAAARGIFTPERRWRVCWTEQGLLRSSCLTDLSLLFQSRPTGSRSFKKRRRQCRTTIMVGSKRA